MEQKLITHRVYIDMDSLFDLRLTALYRVYPEVAKEALMSGAYHARRSDRFDQIEPEVRLDKIQEVLQQRDESLVRESTTTMIVDFIVDLCDRYRLGGEHPLGTAEVRVTLNTYPLKLSSDFKQLIVDAFQEATGAESVTAMHTNPCFLDPLNLRRYDTVIMYDLNEWFTYHAETIMEKRIGGTIFYCPEILQDTPDDFNIPASVIGSAFKTLMLPCMNVEIMPLRMFSIPHREALG